MDVTPELIEQIDFTEKFRGYDQDQVDDFLERVGATISRLTAELNEAHERNRRLESQPAPQAAAQPQPQVQAQPQAPAPAPAPVEQPVRASASSAAAEEELAHQATRTLVLAQRTADATVAEAREEADRMLAEAEKARDEAIEAASGEADGLVADARKRADEEFAERVADITQELERLEADRDQLVSDVTAMEARVDHYRTALETVGESITGFLEDPDSLGEQPPLDIDVTPKSGYSGPGAVSLDETNDEANSPGAFAADDAFSSPQAPSGFESAPAYDEPDHGSFGSTPDSFESRGSLDTRDSFGSQNAFDAAEAPSGRAQPNPFSDHSEPSQSEEEGAADAWGPGSWSQIADEPVADSSADAPASFGAFQVDYTAESEHSAAFGAEPKPGDFEFVSMESEDAFGGPPTEVHKPAAGDPFMADLDAAVNSDSEENDAMSAFFEGDNDPQLRRFGRRR